MQPEPQPLREFLLRLIHLHNLEHMKETFLSMEGRGGGIMQPPTGVNGNRGQQVPQQPFGQPTSVPDLEAIREAVQELYGLGLRKIDLLEFHKPYP